MPEHLTHNFQQNSTVQGTSTPAERALSDLVNVLTKKEARYEGWPVFDDNVSFWHYLRRYCDICKVKLIFILDTFHLTHYVSGIIHIKI